MLKIILESLFQRSESTGYLNSFNWVVSSLCTHSLWVKLSVDSLKYCVNQMQRDVLQRKVWGVSLEEEYSDIQTKKTYFKDRAKRSLHSRKYRKLGVFGAQLKLGDWNQREL